MSRPSLTSRKKTQKRNNSLSLLLDLPKTVGSLQWARDIMHDLSASLFQEAIEIDSMPDMTREEKQKEKQRLMTRAISALKEMVSVCATLLPFQSPKLAAVDVKRTNTEVVKVVNAWRANMELPSGAKAIAVPLLRSDEDIEKGSFIEIDDSETMPDNEIEVDV